MRRTEELNRRLKFFCLFCCKNYTLDDDDYDDAHTHTEHCYCMQHEVVCAVQDCKPPCEGCTPIPSDNDRCCPERYECREYTHTNLLPHSSRAAIPFFSPSPSFAPLSHSGSQKTCSSQRRLLEPNTCHDCNYTHNSCK